MAAPGSDPGTDPGTDPDRGKDAAPGPARGSAAALARVFLVTAALALAISLPVLAVTGLDVADLDIASMVERLSATDWAWALGIALIVSDVFVPLPASVVMAALGVIYGPVAGGLAATLGGLLAGSLAYWLCRALGPGMARRLAGQDGLDAARQLFRRWGFGLIVVSRWLPILPETVAFVAGLARVPFPRFLLALACGAMPIGFIFAAAGHLGREAPLAVMLGAALLPLGGWGIVLWLRRSARR